MTGCSLRRSTFDMRGILTAALNVERHHRPEHREFARPIDHVVGRP
jgi:hypothetical protein